MRWAFFSVMFAAPFAVAQEPLAPPRVFVEVEQATWPSRTRPTPQPLPACPPALPLIPSVPTAPQTNPNEQPKPPSIDDVARQATPNNSSPFAHGTEGGGNSARTFNDNFNGDFAGITITERRQVGTVQRTFFSPGSEGTVTITPVVASPPVATTFFSPGSEGTVTGDVPVYQDFKTILGNRYNGILITDNDSPRPTDRAYFGFNYYNGINPNTNSGPDSIDMFRQTIGFEKTFLSGRASFGMRLPFIQTFGPSSGGTSASVPFTVDGSGNTTPVEGFGNGFVNGGGRQVNRNVGDLSVLLKYAFYDDRTTGDLLSIGLVTTMPTGGGNEFLLADGTTVPNAVLLQPWLGGVAMFRRGYTQMISSYIIPTSSSEPVLANNSVSAGYYLYTNATDRWVNAVVPVIEAHVRTPLTYRDPNGSVFLQDQLNLTFGVHFRTTNATISPSLTVPTVGPNPFRTEAALWFNFRF
jgi:hypothetical protein